MHKKMNRQLLTLELAEELKGKRIKTITHGYSGNAPYEYDIIVGDVTNELKIAEKRITGIHGNFAPYATQLSYWQSYMTAEQLKEQENTLVLLGKNADKLSRDFYSNCFRLYLDFNCFGNEKVFTCSDADRPVIIKEIIN